MTDINAPQENAPAFWRTRALLLPLAIGGLCLAGIGIFADLLLALVLVPLQPDVSDNWWEMHLRLVRLSWHICVIVVCVAAARSIIKRIEGKGSGILSDASLSTAMFNDQSLFVWMLLSFMVADLGDWAIFSFADMGKMPLSSWFVPMMLAWTALRLVGLVIQKNSPLLWSQIQARGSQRATWPGPIKLALLISLAALVLFVGILPRLI